MDKGNRCRHPQVVKLETVYLDMEGHPVPPEQAIKVIIKEYDQAGNVIGAKISFSSDKPVKQEN